MQMKVLNIYGSTCSQKSIPGDVKTHLKDFLSSPNGMTRKQHRTGKKHILKYIYIY